MGSIWTDLVGAQVRFVGERFSTRVIEAGMDHDEVLILLHGNGGHAEAYSRNVVSLGERFHTMAIDLLWHGLSSKPEFERPIPQYCEQILDVMDSLGIERANIEGESLGGWVAMWLGLHYPDRAGKIILNTPAGVRFDPQAVRIDVKGGRDALRERSLAVLDSLSPEVMRSRLEWLMADPSRVTDELVELRLVLYGRPDTNRSLRTVFENSFGAGLGQQFRLEEADVVGLDVPVLVLWTDSNPGVGPDAGRRLAELIPNAMFELIKDAGHWPQWEQPGEHDRVVIGFLTGESGGVRRTES